MKKLLIMIGMMVLILTSCNNEPGVLRLGTMPTYSASIYAVGIEKGFFEDEGIDVELTVFRSSRDRDGAATAGQLDGFMTDIMGAIQLNQGGFSFKITSREYDEFGIMANGGVDIEMIEEAKLGLSENSVIEYIVDTYLEVKAEKIPIIALPDRMGALLNGELDLGIFPQPFMEIIISNGGQMTFTTASDDFHPVVLVFDESYIDNHRDKLEAFYKGYMQTIAYMQTNPYDDYKEALVIHGLATGENVDLYHLPVNAYAYQQVQKDDFDNILNWMEGKELLKEKTSYKNLVETIDIE